MTVLPMRHASVQSAIDEAYQEGYTAARRDFTFRFVLTGPLIIDTSSGMTYLHSRETILLTLTEMRVMRILALHLGRLVPESKISAAIWQTDDEDGWSARASRLGYINTLVARINAKLRQAGVTDVKITSGPGVHPNLAAKLLLKLPPQGEKGETSEEQYLVGYSRAEARKIILNGLTHLREGRLAEAEALFQAAVNGLPDALESAETAVGRPNLDQRVIDALTELGAAEQYVKLRDVASYLKLTPALTAKAILRARSRRSDIMHKRRYGYCFAEGERKAAQNARLNTWKTRTPDYGKVATP